MSTQAAAPQVALPQTALEVPIPPKAASDSAANSTSSEAATISRFRTRWGADLAVHEGNPDFVLSLARGLRVIEAFDSRPEGLSIADIARATELSRAAVRRLLITLELLGYIEATGRKYRLRHRVLHLGMSYLSSSSLAAVSQPTVQRITEELDESSSVCVLDGDEVLCVAGAVRRGLMSLDVTTGSRLPVHCTAAGRVLLAALPEDQLQAHLERIELKAVTAKTIVSREVLARDIRRVREQGFSVIDEELEAGIRAIAVPIVSKQGHTAASLGVGALASRVSLDELQTRFLPVLRDQSRAIGQFVS
ncbi:MAG TPA: IclR family transcriptional regulator C-terminal domain-containing protein [Candidatus Sulfotelmatobacter sp.]|nr:IclR family transcriptional regulator C-terminal domain-containing protein [Candidatus Sulfotelmatobacter sp.]